MMPYTEEPLFFDGADTELFGVLALPRGEARSAALVVAGFGEEKKSSWRNVVELCRMTAERGAASLRFDLSGTGDSDAEFSGRTVPLWTEDIRRAAAFLRRRTGIDVPDAVCLRLGCLLFAASDAGARRAALVAPPFSGASFMREELMRKQLRAAISGLERESIAAMEERLNMEGRLDLDGLDLRAELWEGLRRLEWGSLRVRAAETLVVSVGKGGDKAADVAAAAAAGTAERLSLDSPPFWSVTEHRPAPQLYEAVAEFLCG